MTRSTILAWLAVVAAVLFALGPCIRSQTVALGQQPFPDSLTYANAAWELAHGHGFVTHVKQGPGQAGYTAKAVAPRYPFGTSAVLAPFTLLFPRPEGAEIGERVIVVAYVLAVIAAAWLLGGPLAAIIAGPFMRAAPFAGTAATMVLSDPLAALLTVLVLIALVRGSRRWLVCAGVALGLLVDVRIVCVIALPAAVLAAKRGRWRLLLAGAAPLIALLAYYQWRTFGSPFDTGYSYWLPTIRQWSLRYVAGIPAGSDPLIRPAYSLIGPTGLSNLVFYPAVLVGLIPSYAPPLTGLIGLGTVIRWRHSPGARYTLVLTLLSMLVFDAYFFQAIRFMAPVASLLLIYSAVGIAQCANHVWSRRCARVTPVEVREAQV